MIDRQTYSAVLYPNVGGVPTDLDVIDTTIGLDVAWSPYCQASLTIPTPADPSPFDGRISAITGAPPSRITLGAFQEFCESEPLSTFTSRFGTCADLTAAFGTCADITSDMVSDDWGNSPVPAAVYREFNVACINIEPQASGTSEVTLASDEHFLTDIQRPLQLAGDVTTILDNIGFPNVELPGVSSLRLYVLSMLYRYIYHGVGTVVMAPSNFDFDVSTLNAGTPVASAPYTDVWSFLQTYVQLANARLWCDESRVWHLESSTFAQPGTFTFDVTTSAPDWDEQIGRESDWYNEVAIVYTWTDAAGAQHIETDFATPSGVAGVNGRTYVIQSSQPYPGIGAAAAIVARTNQYGHDPSLTAVNDFSANPGQAATITFPHGTYNGIVGATSWHASTAEMSVTPRQLA